MPMTLFLARTLWIDESFPTWPPSWVLRACSPQQDRVSFLDASRNSLSGSLAFCRATPPCACACPLALAPRVCACPLAAAPRAWARPLAAASQACLCPLAAPLLAANSPPDLMQAVPSARAGTAPATGSALARSYVLMPEGSTLTASAFSTMPASPKWSTSSGNTGESPGTNGTPTCF